MGRTYRRDKQFKPKAHGKTYNKDFKPWKKPKTPDDFVKPKDP